MALTDEVIATALDNTPVVGWVLCTVGGEWVELGPDEDEAQEFLALFGGSLHKVFDFVMVVDPAAM